MKWHELISQSILIVVKFEGKFKGIRSSSERSYFELLNYIILPWWLIKKKNLSKAWKVKCFYDSLPITNLFVVLLLHHLKTVFVVVHLFLLIES